MVMRSHVERNVMQCNNDKFREAYAAQAASRALYKKAIMQSN